jgi:hypothetical protein
VDFILEEAGKLVAMEIKAGSQVTTGDLIGIRAFRDALKRKASLVRGGVLHSGKSRPLDADDIALPWGWMVPAPDNLRSVAACQFRLVSSQHEFGLRGSRPNSTRPPHLERRSRRIGS